MVTPSLPDKVLQETAEAFLAHGSQQAAADALGLSRQTFQSRLYAAKAKGLLRPHDNTQPLVLKKRLVALERLLNSEREERLNEATIRKYILDLSENVTQLVTPPWVTTPHLGTGSPGVPTLMISDLHHGEVVNPAQINGVNKFNIAISHARLHKMVDTTIHLLKIISPDLNYPGIVVPLGGDMISGNIHDELATTNEFNTMPTVLDLFGILAEVITQLADTFGSVFLPCVTGNHGRDTMKIWNKDRHATSFDWLIYNFLAKHFENDPRITFFIPDGPDAYYRVYNHRYLLSHGDQFRGGDGMIGALGPIIRGDHRKRSRNAQINMEYDTLLIGHWHQYIHLTRLIVNGCFPAGTKVMTNAGFLPIEEVVVGDSVMSRDGTQQLVTNVFTKNADRLVGIKVHGLPDVVRSTPNHLVWAVKRASHLMDVPLSRRHLIGAKYGPAQWVPMDFLSPGDYVHVPFPVGEEYHSPIDAESAWAYGLYLAEGSTLLNGGSSKNHNRVCLTMHEREIAILERFAKWFDGKYSTQSRVYIRTKKNGGKTSEFVVSPGRDTCQWFRDTFGHRAIGKKLPTGALFWPDDLKAALLRGWIDGDGHRAKQDDCRDTVSATTISPELAWGMFHISPAAGTWPSLSKLAKGGPRKNDSFILHQNVGQHVIEINGEIFYQIAERFETLGRFDVFDLEVSGEHTYCVGGIGVHNSIKGLDEYAYNNNFPFEPPQQALWLTHPVHGITFRMPVKVGEFSSKVPKTAWVSIPEKG